MRWDDRWRLTEWPPVRTTRSCDCIARSATRDGLGFVSAQVTARVTVPRIGTRPHLVADAITPRRCGESMQVSWHLETHATPARRLHVP